MSETTAAPQSPANMRARIAALIADSGPKVADAVVEHFAQQEIHKRIQMVTDGIKKLNDSETALAAIKPDHRIFDADGAVIQYGFSADQKGKKEKAQKRVARLTAALQTALEGDYKPLDEALKQKDE